MEKRGSKDKSKKHSKAKIVLGLIIIAVSSVLLWACSLFRFDEWHRLEPELILNCERSLLIYDRNGGIACAAGGTKRIWVGIEELSDTTLSAFISAEDARFYEHDGIDLYRILGAAWADIKAGGYVQGASTISQQLVKLSHLSNEKTLDRKLEEAVLATELEGRFSKDEILEMYLNYVYFGGGYYGIEAASLGYFGVRAGELTAAQAAQLAGILKSPAAYSPRINAEASLSRRNNVLRHMYEYGHLGKAELEEALSEEYEILSDFPNERTCIVDFAIAEASVILGMDVETLKTSGYSVYTTIDTEINAACAKLMQNDGSFPSENSQGALTVLAPDGSILAMQAGRGEYVPGSFNRSVGMERQPGSLIKPVLVYAPALQLGGYSPASVLKDEPMSFGDYTPRNSEDKYYGSVTLREAVTKSLNVPAVSVLSSVGLYNSVMFAERLGISFEGEVIGLPLALGGFTHGVSPLEIAGAYAAIANGGVFMEPTCITKIVDDKGEIVYERKLAGERVLSEENAFLLTSMLQSAASEGTARRLLKTGLPLAAKTGTVVDAGGVRDAWCAAFSTEFVAVAWMGADSAAEGSLPSEAVGGSHPALMLGSLFTALYSNRQYKYQEVPDTIVECTIDLREKDGGKIYLADDLTPAEYRMSEYFREGEEPERSSGYWSAPEPPEELGWSINSDGYPVITFAADNRALNYLLYKRDASGTETELGVFKASYGLIRYTDTAAEKGSQNCYYVITEHPEIKENGRPIRSRPSKELFVTIPLSPYP